MKKFSVLMAVPLVLAFVQGAGAGSGPRGGSADRSCSGAIERAARDRPSATSQRDVRSAPSCAAAMMQAATGQRDAGSRPSCSAAATQAAIDCVGAAGWTVGAAATCSKNPFDVKGCWGNTLGAATSWSSCIKDVPAAVSACTSDRAAPAFDTPRSADRHFETNPAANAFP